MGLSVVLDVFLGLALLYLLLSLLVTTLNEIVITGLRFRAKSLQNAIVAIIDDENVRQLFYSNGLIATSQTASRGGDPAKRGATSFLARRAAKWLPAEPQAPKPAAQATAAPDVGQTAAKGPGQEQDDASGEPAGAATGAALKTTRIARPDTLVSGEARNPDEVDHRGMPADVDHPSYFDSRIFAKALLTSVARAHSIGDALKLKEASDAIEKLPPSNLKDVLLAQLGETTKTLDDLEKSVARWYDVTMERLSGEFLRLSKRWALLIGMLVALVANADSIAVGRALSGSPELRKQISDVAATLIAPDARSCDPAEQKKTAPPADPAGSAKPEVDKISCLARQATTLQSELAAFPIGWSSTEVATLGFGGWLIKLIGIVWTGFALSLGAPFWFDMLQKITSVRGAGPKPPTQAEKDRHAASSTT